MTREPFEPTRSTDSLLSRAMALVDRLLCEDAFDEAERIDALLEDALDAVEYGFEELNTESWDDGDDVIGIEDFWEVPWKEWEPWMHVAAADGNFAGHLWEDGRRSRDGRVADRSSDES